MNGSLEGHVDSRYDGDLNYLHCLMLEIGGLVLDQMRLAMQALLEHKTSHAHTVIEREDTVDALETKIDNAIMSTISKRAPLARDLRVVMAFSKAVTDMERIGDEAVRLANVTIDLYDNNSTVPNQRQLRGVFSMSKYVFNLLEQSLTVFDELDVEAAKILLENETELLDEFESNLRKLATFVLEDARNVGHAVNLTLITKILERTGQYSMNLAEYVVYLVAGQDIRHRK